MQGQQADRKAFSLCAVITEQRNGVIHGEERAAVQAGQCRSGCQHVGGFPCVAWEVGGQEEAEDWRGPAQAGEGLSRSSSPLRGWSLWCTPAQLCRPPAALGLSPSR